MKDVDRAVRGTLFALFAVAAAAANAAVVSFVPQGGANRTPEVVRALESAADGTALRFAPGEYHFFAEGAKKAFLVPSNNQSGEKNVVFPVFGKKGIEVDGGGATFVFHDGTFPFAVVGSADIRIGNFTATTRYAPCVQFEVLEKSAEGFLVRFAPGSCPIRCDEGGHLVFLREDGELSSATTRFSIHGLRQVKIHYLYAGDTTADKRTETLPTTFVHVDAESRGRNEMFLRYRKDDHPKALRECPYACHVPLGFNLEQERAHILVFSDSSERLAFADITANRVAGMGFVAQMCGDVNVRNVKIVPAGDDLASATADAFQFVNCYGKTSLEGCVVDGTLDDALNVHGNYLVAENVRGSTLTARIGHFEQSGFFPFRPGDTILFREPKRRTPVGRAKIVRTGEASSDLQRMDLVCEGELPALPEGTLIEAVSRYPDFHMTRCDIRDLMSMRISGGGKFLFERNRIANGYVGIQINDLPEFWFESGPIRDVVIRDNVFESCVGRCISVGVSGFKAGDRDIPLVHRGLRISGNRFLGVRGEAFGGIGYTESEIDTWATMPPRLAPGSTDPEKKLHPTYASRLNGSNAVARPATAWLRGAVMYQLFTRMFTPEGTFAAAERKLPELKDAGITVIYLTPHQLADDDADPAHWSARQKASGFGNPKNPYRQKDFFAVDPEYGTKEDLVSFVNAAHRLGMRVMFDLVYFHCGPCAVFLEEHPDYIVRGFDGRPHLGGWAFPEMNIASSGARELLWSNMESFVRDYGVDGFRCDVGDMLPVAFWEEGARRVRALKGDCALMCEGLKAEDQLEAFDLSYGFYVQWTLCDLLAKRAPASALEAAWRAERRDFPKGFHWMRCFENHDFANCAPGERRKEALYGHARNAAMIATDFLLDGVPMLYNGQEIADAAPHSIWSDRDHGGWHIDWSRRDDAAAKERLKLVKRLTALRRAHPELFDAPVVWNRTDDPRTQYSFTRPLADGTSLTLTVDLVRETFDIAGF